MIRGMGFFDFLRSLFELPPRRPAPPPARPQTPQRPQPVAPSSLNTQPGTTVPPKPKIKPVKQNLDAAQFAPLSTGDSKKEIGRMGAQWQRVFWERRDVIPPASDPRTGLIDRGMVGAGLITPDQLVTIHTVGDEMARVKPDLLTAAAEANQAVRQSKEERAALKEQKKREAAERSARTPKASRSAMRRTLFFSGAAFRKASPTAARMSRNCAKPACPSSPIPPTSPRRWRCRSSACAGSRFIPTPRVSRIMSASAFRKKAAARASSPRRTKTSRAARNGFSQRFLRSCPSRIARSGELIPERNTLSNARPHVRQAMVLNLDLKDFFPTITFPRVCGMFKNLGYSPAASAILALLCTEAPRKIVTYAGKIFHVATGTGRWRCRRAFAPVPRSAISPRGDSTRACRN